MRRGHRLLLRSVAAVVGLAALVWTVRWLGPRRILELALEADPLLLFLSVLPLVARFLIWAAKWTRMLRRHRPVPFRDSLRMLMAGSFINLTTPTAKLGGGVLRAALLRKHHGWKLTPAFGWVISDQATNALGGMLLFGVLALTGGLLSSAERVRAYTVTGSITLLVFCCLILLRGWLWRAAGQPRLAVWLARITPARFRENQGEAPTAGWLQPVLRPLLLETRWSDILLASSSFATLCASNLLVLRALGVDAPLWIVAVAVAVGYFAGNGLGPWGGIGVTEAAMSGVYIQLGLGGEVATAGVLLHRASYYLIGLGWGGAALMRTGRASQNDVNKM